VLLQTIDTHRNGGNDETHNRCLTEHAEGSTGGAGVSSTDLNGARKLVESAIVEDRGRSRRGVREDAVV